MGNLQSLNNDHYDEASFNEFKISVDFNKAVQLQLEPLIYWSLQEIRHIYAPFRQRKGSPLLNRSQFFRLMRLSRIQSFNLYKLMYKKRKYCSKQDSINVFQIISILVLTSFTNYAYKIHFLFNLFDLDSSRGLQFRELMLCFKSIIRGFCILTDQPLPDNVKLEKYAKVMFSRADLNNDQCLQLGEVLNWFEGNNQAFDLFKRFQPKGVIGKEDYQIFKSFTKYTEPQIRLIFHRIQKQYKKLPLDSMDYELLTNQLDQPQMMPHSLNSTTRNSRTLNLKERISDFKTNQLNYGEETQNKEKKFCFHFLKSNTSRQKQNNIFGTFLHEASILQEQNDSDIKENTVIIKQERSTPILKRTNSNTILNSLSKISSSQSYKPQLSFKKTQSTILDSIKQKTPFKLQTKNAQNFWVKSLTARNFTSIGEKSFEETKINLSTIRQMDNRRVKKKFHNIIILKGKTITKKQIFDLRDYFENLSGGKKWIMIENFMESFNEEKYNHMKSVAASLFNFLDGDQNGKVTFRQLIHKLYPDLTSKHLDVIKMWDNEYDQNYNLSKKIKTYRDHDNFKKRILPKTCATRYKEMFNFFDKDLKGYVDLKDMKRVLSDVSTDREILDAFQDNDKNKDGKLDLKQFMHILLPADLEIEGF